ncbi:DUF2177 family protein [Glaciecola punicea]|jgi:uncharacterized membrane protein|uniref:DUF2177 family protein n=1 Tax=Glaciecola punicea TaxID=56804 RepID=UPI0009F4CDE7|nr:DUF2177 family protein [Glaciecola punicea]
MLTNVKKFMRSIVISLTCICISFAILDAFWLGYFATNWYQTEMQSLMRSQFITWPWLIFYLIYTSVTFLLAVLPNREKLWTYAAIDGALLGLASYGAYNLTAYSIIEGFTLKIMLTDWVWGTFLTSCCATAGWFGFQAYCKKS